MWWYKKQDMKMHSARNDKSLKLDFAFALDVFKEENVAKWHMGLDL